MKDKADRPITFAFNGGPGSASMYVHIGCFGPRRLDLDKDGNPTSLPTKLKGNESSIIDITDLVIVDAVGTGYSRPAEGADTSAFYSYEGDISTMGDFIRLYINRKGRWGSEKYLAGESYGTTRAVGVCEYLSGTYQMDLNGLMLISSVNDFLTVSSDPGNDMPYAFHVPSYAADAWYHKKVAKSYQEMKLEDFLDEVRTFVEDTYAPALFKGAKLSAKEKDVLAKQLSGHTGLSKEFVLSHNLRISMDDFRKELLADKNLLVGRIDGRIAGAVSDGSFAQGVPDPSGTSQGVAYGNAMNSYLTDELGYQTDEPYLSLSFGPYTGWSMSQKLGGGYLSQEQTIFDCLAGNKFLKIWVLCGYYDGATPFYGAEWVFNHVFMDDASKERVSFTYYPCGRMIYLEQDSYAQFRKDAEAWYGA